MSGTGSHVQVGRHRLSVTVRGSGQPAVVIEPGFGGTAGDWQDVAQRLASDTTIVTYDRAPYGTSSPAVHGRTPQEIAGDLHGLLAVLGITGPLVLVGHSSGGRCVRQFAARYDDRVAGMVLVDSGHEAQGQLLVPLLPRRLRARERFMIAILLFRLRSRHGFLVRRSMAREYRALQRQTAADAPLPAGSLGDRPLVVLTRPPSEDMAEDRAWRVWHDLHADLAQLSANHRHVIAADGAGHNLQADDPELIVASIRDVVDSARTHLPLRTAADGRS